MLSRRTMMAGVATAVAAPVTLARAADGTRFARADIALQDGRAWMAAKVNGAGPFFFFIDTGATISLIDDTAARRLGLEGFGTSDVVGIGGVSHYPYYRVGRFMMQNGTVLPDLLFAGSHALDGDAVGLLSAGFFTSYDSDLDFGKGELRIYPGGRPNLDGMTMLKSRFDGPDQGHRIAAEATIGGYSGMFLLDTGAPGEARLEGRHARESGLWAADRPYAPVVGRGIGNGEVPGRLVRTDRLTLGPFDFDRPLVQVPQPGQINATGHDGLIGLGTLAHLNLATKHAKGAVWASRNTLRLPPQSYPLSGMLVDFDHGPATVVDVGTGSPAASADVKAGDRVIGAPAAIMRRLDARAGSRVTFTLERDGKRRDVQLTLADYL